MQINTLLLIARVQFRTAWSQSGAVWVATLLFLITGASAVMSWQHERLEDEARQATQGQARLAWEQQGSKDPHSAAHFGMYAVKPLSPLHWFDPGIDAFLGTAIYLEAHKQNTPTASGSARIEWQRLLTLPSPAAILQVFLPLLANLCGFGAISVDRESGILRQTLSTGVSPAALGFGKLAGSVALLAALALPSVAGIAIAASATGTSPSSALLLDSQYVIYARLSALCARRFSTCGHIAIESACAPHSMASYLFATATRRCRCGRAPSSSA